MAKAIRRFDKSTARRLIGAIKLLANDPRPSGCIQLKGKGRDNRVVDEIEDDERIVLVLKVGPAVRHIDGGTISTSTAEAGSRPRSPKVALVTEIACRTSGRPGGFFYD